MHARKVYQDIVAVLAIGTDYEHAHALCMMTAGGLVHGAVHARSFAYCAGACTKVGRLHSAGLSLYRMLVQESWESWESLACRKVAVSFLCQVTWSAPGPRTAFGFPIPMATSMASFDREITCGEAFRSVGVVHGARTDSTLVAYQFEAVTARG